MGPLDQHLQRTNLESVLLLVVNPYGGRRHCNVYQECEYILFRILESVIGQCIKLGDIKSCF